MTKKAPKNGLDTGVIWCGDNLEKLKHLPDASVDLIYIDPPFNSNRNYEVFWGETKEKRAFEAPVATSTSPTCGRVKLLHPVGGGTIGS